MTLVLCASAPNNSRVMCEIKRTLGRGASTPLIERNKDKVEGHKMEIQGILDALGAPSSHLGQTIHAGRRAANLAPPDPHDATTIPAPESGMSLAQSSQILYMVPIVPYFSTQHSSLWTFDQTRVRSA